MLLSTLRIPCRYLIFPGPAGKLAFVSPSTCGANPHTNSRSREMSDVKLSLSDPHMDKAILYAGFSSAICLLNALFLQGQKGGPLNADEQQYAFDRGELLFHEALERETKRLPKKTDLFQN
jgi:hypothetical protein